jgi:YfiH family protein
MQQIHEANVEVVTEARDDVPGTDGLVTNVRGLALGVLVADCVPVLLSDAGSGVVGVAHVGRRGLVAGVALGVVDAMCAIGARREAIAVTMGPAICGLCYELPADMQADVEATVPGSASTTRRGTPGVELRGGIRKQLDGLTFTTAASSAICTAESPHHFSFRRDGVTGRQAGVIVVPVDDEVMAAEGHR